jgi:hypothetical protein
VKNRVGPLFENCERAKVQPAVSGGGAQRPFAQPLAVGRVGKDEIERLDGARWPQIGGVTAKDFRAALKAERVRVFAQKSPALGGFFDKQAKARAARQRLNAKRAGS